MPQGEVRLRSYGSHPSNYATAAPNTDVSITLPAGARQELSGICWSYNDTPAAGRLTIAGGGFGFDIDITQGGPGFIPFPHLLHATDNAQIVVTLYAAGAAVVGKLNLLGRGAN